jgi:hypothetical protein
MYSWIKKYILLVNSTVLNMDKYLDKMRKHPKIIFFVIVSFIAIVAGFKLSGDITGILNPQDFPDNPLTKEQEQQLYRGIVFSPEFRVDTQEYIKSFEEFVSEVLVPTGINLIVFDMHWNNFHFTSVSELDALKQSKKREFGKREAMKLAKICKENGIHVIVGMNFLTHQDSGQLLKAFPQFEWPGNKKMWNPLEEEVNQIAFKMADELIEAFNPEGFHIGMDEGRNFDAKKLPGAEKYTTPELYAKAINEYHQFFVEEKGLNMLMWSDMLEGRYADAPVAEAVSMIPKDIIMISWDYDCDWRYPWLGRAIEKVAPLCPYRNENPSNLANLGFKVMVSPWDNPLAAVELAKRGLGMKRDKLKGILYTTWSPHVVYNLKRALIEGQAGKKTDPTVSGISESIRNTIGMFKSSH